MRCKLILLSALFLIIFINIVSAFPVIGQFEVKRENYCGDGIIAETEECDLDNLNDQTCIIRGYDLGTLTCTEGCMFNESLCEKIPPGPTPNGGGGGGGEQVGTSTECSDKRDNDGDGKIDYPNDPGCTHKFDNSEEDASCYSTWQCEEWSYCINSTQTRICTDIYQCKEEYIKKETRKCVEILPEIIPPTRCYILYMPCYFWIILIIFIIIFSIIIMNKIYFKSKRKKK